MKIKLSQNAFARTYGPYTYLFNQVSDADFLFRDAGMFFDFVSRDYQESEDIVSQIANVCDVAPSEVRDDFVNLMKPLKNVGIIVDDSKTDYEFSYQNKPQASLLEIYSEDEKSETAEFSKTSPKYQLYDYFSEHPTPFSLKVDLTQRCTERCLHCYVADYHAPFLPFEKIIEVLTEAREMGTLDVTFTGGECMMHPQFAEILRFAREKDFMVTILSNLTLCDDEKVALLREIRPRFLQVSLYGSTAEIHDHITQRSGSFIETTRAIEKLLAADVPLQFNCPILKENYRDINNIKKFEKIYGIKGNYNVAIIGKADGNLVNVSHGLSIDELKEYYELTGDALPKGRSDDACSDDYVCRTLGHTRINLHSTGNYYPCTSGYNLVLGNCYKQSLREVWEQSELLKQLRELRMKDYPKCLACSNLSVCKICPVTFFNETGSLYSQSANTCRLSSFKAHSM